MSIQGDDAQHRAPPPDSRGGRTAVLIANYLSCFAIGLAVGGSIPLLSLIMERRGVSETLIGANTAMGSIGVICIAPFVPMIVRRFGLAPSVIAGIVLSVASFLAMAVFDSLTAWFVLRPLYAGGLGIHWIVSETWMNTVASNRNRGRIMAIYVTTIAAGMAAGPAILGVTGTEGWMPFAVFGAATFLAALPLALVARYAPQSQIGGHGTPALLIRGAPTVFAAVVAVGLYSGACFVFLPIYGLRSGMAEADAVFLLTAFLAGNLLFQVPIGWLADRINLRLLLLACAAVAIVAPFLIAGVIGAPVVLAIFMALWGGAVFAFYTVGITMLGQRFQAGE
ncbi:MAG: MFS transporter, partial [Proteobacteria bacterium]|nr:MFS transporter [Pseudomonadota bacterium]